MSYLTSLNGGPIAARDGPDHASVPDYAVFPATFDVSRRPGRVVERGTVILAGARESLILTVLRNVGRPEGRLPSDMVAARVAPTARAIARRLPP